MAVPVGISGPLISKPEGSSAKLDGDSVTTFGPSSRALWLMFPFSMTREDQSQVNRETFELVILKDPPAQPVCGTYSQVRLVVGYSGLGAHTLVWPQTRLGLIKEMRSSQASIRCNPFPYFTNKAFVASRKQVYIEDPMRNLDVYVIWMQKTE